MTQSQKSLFPETKNVGDPAISGKMLYDSESQVYEATGAGTNMWNDQDEFFFAARKMNSDFILTSKVEIITKTGDAHRKMGIMIRQSMDANAPYADIILHADGLLSLQYRTKQGAMTEELNFTEVGAQYLQLEKNGSKILARIAQSEKAFTSAKEIELPFEEPFYVGLVICSHDAALTVTGLFTNVHFDVGADEDS